MIGASYPGKIPSLGAKAAARLSGLSKNFKTAARGRVIGKSKPGMRQTKQTSAACPALSSNCVRPRLYGIALMIA